MAKWTGLEQPITQEAAEVEPSAERLFNRPVRPPSAALVALLQVAEALPPAATGEIPQLVEPAGAPWARQSGGRWCAYDGAAWSWHDTEAAARQAAGLGVEVASGGP